MIIVKLSGGLGNQIFQYAAGRRMALINNVELMLDISYYENIQNRYYSLHNFNIVGKCADKRYIERFNMRNALARLVSLGNTRLQYYLGNLVLKEEQLKINTDLFRATKSAYLDGYWGDECYYFDIAKKLISELNVTSLPAHIIERWIEPVISSQSVSVHVRRGDYCLNEHRSIFNMLDDEYYSKAISLIIDRLPNPTFYIFSDDIENVMNMTCFKDINSIYVNIEQDKADYIDFAIMKSCKHNIIANSTFSWWAAWLNTNPDKIVISPQKWYSNPTYQAAYGVTLLRTKQSWIKI